VTDVFLATTFLAAGFLVVTFLNAGFADFTNLLALLELTVFATTFDFLVEAMMFSLRARNIFILLD
jgi:hypothetical protein